MKRLLQVLFLTGILAAFCAISAGATWLGVGTVTGDEVRLRADPVNGSTLGSGNKGTTVIVVGEVENEPDWYEVDLRTQMGFMSAKYITLETKKDIELGWGIVTTQGSNLNLRSGPDAESERIYSIPMGKAVKVHGVEDGWLKISYGSKEGFVSSDYITLTLDENGTRRDESVSVASGNGSGSNAISKVGAKIIANAKAQLGKRYVWGGSGPSTFDCSGFTYYVAKISGYSIPRGATSQWKGNPGKYISSYKELRPGDFVYIRNPHYANGYPISHTMIYLGNNQIIHADSTKNCISIKSFENYKKYFKGAWRLG